MFSDSFPLILIAFLSCLIFGFLFNLLVEWVNENGIWDVSISVVIGVFFTVLMPTVIFFSKRFMFWEFAVLLFICFAGSGTPMLVGSVRRHAKMEQENKNKKARPLGNASSKVRDHVVMELATLADEITESSSVDDLASLLRRVTVWVHRLHVAVRFLKSM